MNAARLVRPFGANVVVSEKAGVGLTGHLQGQVVGRLRVDDAVSALRRVVGVFQKSSPV
jgi:accessory colonization factor AcfC